MLRNLRRLYATIGSDEQSSLRSIETDRDLALADATNETLAFDTLDAGDETMTEILEQRAPRERLDDRNVRDGGVHSRYSIEAIIKHAPCPAAESPRP